MKDIIIDLFGEYIPLTVGGSTVTTVAGLDYEWLAGVLLFAIVLTCLLKMIGGLLKNA